MAKIGTQAFRLGDLVTELGLVGTKDLNEALEIKKETGLPIGNVLTMSGFIAERQLDAVLKAQSLLRDGLIDMNMVRKAVDLVSLTTKTFEDALKDVGWVSPQEASSCRLGDLLLESQLVSEVQLEDAINKSLLTGLPTGRLLVLSGTLTEQLLSAALNAQVMIRDRKLSKRDAILGLKEGKSRGITTEDPMPDRGSYQMPAVGEIRLGELLSLAGIVSKSDMLSAAEQGFLKHIPIGQVLTQQNLISQSVLHVSLELQKALATKAMQLSQALETLKGVVQNESLGQSVLHDLQVSNVNNNQQLSLVQFLRQSGGMTESDVIKIHEYATNNSEILARLLVLTEVMTNANVAAALTCIMLVEQNVLTQERAYAVFTTACQKGLTIEQVLDKEDKVSEKAPSSLPEQAPKTSVPRQIELWDKFSQSAEQALKRGEYVVAENYWYKALLIAEKLDAQDTRYAYSLDRIADVMIQQAKYDQSEPLLKRSLDLKLKMFGKSHLSIAAGLNNLAKLYYYEARYDQAAASSCEFIEVCRNTLGPEHPDLIRGVHNLATIYHVQGKYTEAETQYKSALDICERTLGKEDPIHIALLRSYASLLKTTHREAEADRFDAFAKGVISGSWKEMSMEASQSLHAKDNSN
jgi:tetratricopeptide (TPR) repeat protein